VEGNTDNRLPLEAGSDPLDESDHSYSARDSNRVHVPFGQVGYLAFTKFCKIAQTEHGIFLRKLHAGHFAH